MDKTADAFTARSAHPEVLPLAHSTSGKQIMTSFPLVIFFHQNLIDKNHKTC